MIHGPGVAPAFSFLGVIWKKKILNVGYETKEWESLHMRIECISKRK